MTSSTLKFGPEWLRNLSDGSVSSAPSSSVTSSSSHGSSSQGTVPVPKYKLAEFRYGREEMLALFSPPVPVPEELKDVKAILSDRQLQPLALQLETDDEQHLFSQPVNSAAVLRLTSRGSSAPLCLREVERGRGRGRGRTEGRGFYSRVPIEEDSFSRGRIPRDGHDTESRGRGFGYTGRSFDDMSTTTTSPHGEFSRSMSTENWRDTRKHEESKGNWRDLNQRPTNRRWKEPWEKSFDGSRDRVTDRRMSEDLCQDRSVPMYRRSTSSNFAYEEESDLPEWSTDDVDDIGTFDSSGAFMSLKELEQQERKDRESGDPWQNREEEIERSKVEIDKASSVIESDDGMDKQHSVAFEPEKVNCFLQQQHLELASDSEQVAEGNMIKAAEVMNAEMSMMEDTALALSSNGNAMAVVAEKKANVEDAVMSSIGPVDAIINNSNCQLERQETEVNFDHLELQVENLYASISADEENVVNVEKEKGFLPADHEDAKKWFYRDPQGQVQGPFAAGEMAEWFSAGYFSPNLVVKQGSDECFVPLGELIKKMGSVPFISAPMKISPTVGNNPVEVQQMQQQQQDPLKLLLMQQQQQQALPQQLQQQLRNLQEPFGKMSPAQQQQLLLQLILKQQQVAAPTNQQQKPAKTNTINRPGALDAVNLNPFHRLSTASSIASNNAAPSFHRSMSQPSGIEVSALPSNLLYGLTTTTVAGGNATNMPTSAMSSASALWRSSSCVPSSSNPSWLPDSGGGTGLWNLELPKTITAAELEEIQYLALEKAQQQQQQSSQSLSSLREPHQLKLQELVARAAAEKQRDINGTGGALSGLDQIRELLQQQKQQMDIVRLAEEQRRLLDEKRRILEMNPRLLRQDRTDDFYRQQQLENLCRLQNDPLASTIQERDALDVRQLLALQQAQPWATTHNRAQLTTSGTVPGTSSTGLFQHKDNGTSSSGASSIIQQELINKHLKLNEMKTALNQWSVGAGNSSRWAGESGMWGTSLPSKSPIQWDTTTAAANNKTINSMIPYVPGGGLSSQVKQEFIQKMAKLKEELTHWCENVLKSMLTCSSMDIPTFIRHLMELTSPAEVNQFVQMYLGDTDDAKKFVKQFVEKHSRMQYIQQEAVLMQYLSSGSQW